MTRRVRAGCALLALLAFAGRAHALPPEKLYQLNCWGCHRSSGEGIPNTAPALRGAADFLKVPGGREYLIEVPGVGESVLDDRDVAQLMNWILRTFSPGRLPADFVPYSEAEVARLRKVRLAEVAQTRKRFIAEMIARAIRPAEK
jgi:hypothetical protein